MAGLVYDRVGGPAGKTLVFITFSEVKLAKTVPRPRKGWWPWSK
jgi:hypothetical protein